MATPVRIKLDVLPAKFRSSPRNWLRITTIRIISQTVIFGLFLSFILLTTFAERARLAQQGAGVAAISGASSRLRPILMTSLAMIAGMVPMAIGFGEGGQQTAPLGRAVIGGLALATLATLLVLPGVFSIVRGNAGHESPSMHPDDLVPRPEVGSLPGRFMILAAVEARQQTGHHSERDERIPRGPSQPSAIERRQHGHRHI